MDRVAYKTCSKCKLEQSLDNFGKLSKSKDGLRNCCKVCRKQESSNAEQKELAKKRSYKWLAKNPTYSSDYSKSEIGKEKRRARFKKHYYNNKSKFTIRQREKRQTDANIKLASNLRSRMWSALKGITKSKNTIELIGCSIEELWKHLENKFEHGMTRENYGKWHVDHIVPCCSFDMSKEDDQKRCFHYTNLQPLWAIDNLKKSGS